MKLIAALVVAFSLTGCSASSLLSTVIPDTPDITAQAGKENIKQTVGLTNKSEDSHDAKVGKSNVGQMDSSNKKVETIKAGTIQAESISVTTSDPMWLVVAMCIFMVLASALVYMIFRANKKAP